MMLPVVFIVCALVATTFALPLRKSSYDLIEGRATGDVEFYLYTKSNPTTPHQLYIGDEDSVKNSYYDNSRYTKIIIHGWVNFYNTTPNVAVREAYFSKADYNLISIDWNAYAKLNYLSARAKVPVVGEDVAEFIDFLNEKFGLKFDELVVIGHSLGAHVAGFAGKRVKRGKIGHIVALDPAYPLYSYSNPNTRLASTDANYVHSIQTNGNGQGFLNPIGTASFYPNWGQTQPGCGNDSGCSHGRSVAYYAEAVRGYSFTPMYECESYDNILARSGCDTLYNTVEIGDPLEIQRRNGIFYFETNDKEPFGRIGDRFIFL